MKTKVAILVSDTLREIGLAHIINEYLGAEPVCATCNNTTTVEGCDIFITDTATFAGIPDFFMPRRAKTIIITPGGSPTRDNHIPCDTSIDSVISIIGDKIKQNKALSESNKSSTLSSREIDVLRLVATGLSNKEIADRLNISTNTVMTHRKNISSKLGIRSVSGLSLFAIMNGYISTQ